MRKLALISRRYPVDRRPHGHGGGCPPAAATDTATGTGMPTATATIAAAVAALGTGAAVGLGIAGLAAGAIAAGAARDAYGPRYGYGGAATPRPTVTAGGYGGYGSRLPSRTPRLTRGRPVPPARPLLLRALQRAR